MPTTPIHDNSANSRTGTDLTRRTLLKATAAGLFAGIAAPLLPLASPAYAASGAGASKPLIIYYSLSGNTGAVARQIQELTGGDILELQTVNPYPNEYRATTEQAKQELESGYKPPLKTTIDNLEAYDVVFVGSPCWWGTVATPVITFLSEYDFSGKTIVPFMTHEGSGLGRTVAHIKSLCPGAKVTEGLAVRGGRAHAAGDTVDRWLHEIGMAR